MHDHGPSITSEGGRCICAARAPSRCRTGRAVLIAVRVRLRRVAVIVYSIVNASFARLSQTRLTSVDSFHAHGHEAIGHVLLAIGSPAPSLQARFCLAAAHSNALVNSARQGSSARILTSAQLVSRILAGRPGYRSRLNERLPHTRRPRKHTRPCRSALPVAGTDPRGRRGGCVGTSFANTDRPRSLFALCAAASPLSCASPSPCPITFSFSVVCDTRAHSRAQQTTNSRQRPCPPASCAPPRLQTWPALLHYAGRRSA